MQRKLSFLETEEDSPVVPNTSGDMEWAEKSFIIRLTAAVSTLRSFSKGVIIGTTTPEKFLVIRFRLLMV